MKHENARNLEREPETILDLKCKHSDKYIKKKTIISFIQPHENERIEFLGEKMAKFSVVVSCYVPAND